MFFSVEIENLLPGFSNITVNEFWVSGVFIDNEIIKYAYKHLSCWLFSSLMT